MWILLCSIPGSWSFLQPKIWSLFLLLLWASSTSSIILPQQVLLSFIFRNLGFSCKGLKCFSLHLPPLSFCICPFLLLFSFQVFWPSKLVPFYWASYFLLLLSFTCIGSYYIWVFHSPPVHCILNLPSLEFFPFKIGNLEMGLMLFSNYPIWVFLHFPTAKQSFLFFVVFY